MSPDYGPNELVEAPKPHRARNQPAVPATAVFYRRILLVGDTPAFHDQLRAILGYQAALPHRDDAEAAAPDGRLVAATIGYDLDSACLGQEGLAKVCRSLDGGAPYALAFIDTLLPPSWGGAETVGSLWQADPLLQIVICTSGADHGWDEVLERFDADDRLLILKKPFDPAQVRQLASSLTAKRQFTQQAAIKLAALEGVVQEQITELKKANAALKSEIVQHAKVNAELKLAASVFHSTMDGVMISDHAGYILAVNPAFTVITGYSAAEVVGRHVDLRRSNRHDSEFYSQMRAELLRDGRWEGEVWNRRQNGEAYLEWLSIGVVAGDDGRPLRYVSVFNDVTEMRQKDERIRHLAFRDPLTGLPNRAMLLDRLERSLALSPREGEGLGVMFVDLDRFKHINDTLGHEIGDALLQEVARRLTLCLRETDTVARSGGDEFVILLEHVKKLKTFVRVAEKITACLSAPMVLGGHHLHIGASIGIAAFPGDGADAVELMKHADAAMYAAKSAGRGTYRFFQRAMANEAEQHLKLEMSLRSAVSNGELELFYQPKVSLATNAVCGVEALLRWRHPVLGLVSPNNFIPLAEETGMIAALGDWVLEEACRQSRAWRDQGMERLKIAVNVSSRQMQGDGLVERIAELVEKYQISPTDLEIELTESMIMANPEEVSGILARLRATGITIAVDDFGTGYSSLAYLRRLPIDVLKIDSSFVTNADHNEVDAQIVRIIVDLGDVFNLEIVAEGVETASQAEFLKSCGCSITQGFLHSPPLPAAVFRAWLRIRSRLVLAQ